MSWASLNKIPLSMEWAPLLDDRSVTRPGFENELEAVMVVSLLMVVSEM